MINTSEKIKYWAKFFYDKEEYLEKSLKEVSNLEVDTISNIKKIDSSWELKWENLLLIDSMDEYIPATPPEFWGFTERFLLLAINKLEENISDSDSRILHTSSSFFKRLLSSLFERIMDCSYKTLILELNVLSNQGLLRGETPEQRYQYFENLLHDKEYLRQLANEYPVLIRSLLRITEKWTAHVSEVLDRFKADYPKIVSHMPDVNQFGKLVQLHIGAGDTHDGRSVTILEFTTGGKLVYKPRSLRVDKEYYKILSWMQHFGVPHTKMIKNLDCGSYGWTEFVEHSECNSTEEISGFYKNMGVNLAIMYMFNATDFHYENIIAHGSSPVVIDLESLFHRHISTKKFEHNASGHAYEIISHSVMSSGMLPQYIFKSDTYSGIDISGIFGHGGKKVPNVLNLTHRGTDRMRLEKGEGESSKTYNLPYYNNEVVDSYRYIDDIEQGFAQAYRIMMENKHRLKEMIREFDDVRVRVIVRDTRAYGELMRTLYHPDLLRDELDRKVVLHRLWLQCLADPKHLKFVSHEMRDIEDGDIPIFYTSPSERDAWSSNNERIPQLFEQSGIEVVINKIDKMGEKDLKEQLQLLNMSVLSSKPDLYTYCFPEIQFIKSNDVLGSNWKDEYVQLAISIGESLVQSAVISSSPAADDITWIGLVANSEDERKLRLVPVGNDLYNGNGGIALFLGYLSELTTNNNYKDMARKALQPLIEIMRNTYQSNDVSLNVGVFEVGSIGGGVFTTYQLSRLWNDEDLLQTVKEFLPYYCNLIDKDTSFDYIGGAAGAIDVLLHVYHGTGWKQALQGAEKCAEHLLQNAQTLPDGSMIWLTTPNSKPYVGYSHGVSGIIASLSSLYRVTQHKKYIEYIEKGLQYERANYSAELKNWITPNDTARVTWCHGAPGILLSRLRLLENGYWDAHIDQEINIALETTLKLGFGTEPVYCHGDFGQLEILLYANSVLERNEDTINIVRAYLLRLLNDQPWNNTGVHRAFDIKGLMGGLSGIGFGLLKQAFPERVPNILNLENDKFFPSISRLTV
ncbi:type 2 lantibiotic biosynthesis protein LanM [Paenibacillus sp. DS2363]|uniref:type 2 lanthipeptide synthetase LanM family protein n=1 Tax=Paenibacillus TaxID=44249 RepID=UPI001C8EB502|nr:type 2 lanthipeptide synthetase LanM family protein [Paenibacillus xylanexedens]MBY0115767.1 type 2 lantipeptide synthetase LanM [Paenibacillus xylanexedens]MCP1423744.1 type 2 lantibiotic biosynthesis protein LanM [Paenibacillus xylanexedens]